MFAVCVLGGLSASASAEPPFAPRTLANGRPACGNIVGKGPKRIACETTTPVLAQTPARAEPEQVERIDWHSYIDTAAAAASAVIRPRVLRSGRPACGNTGGKAAEPRECSMTDVTVEQHPDLATELARL